MKFKLSFIVISVFLMFTCFVAEVFAENFCNAELIDEAEMLTIDQEVQVVKVMKKLFDKDIDVRVHLLSSMHGHHSLDDYKANMLSKCSSWRSQDGGMKNNLVVFILSPKPSLAIYYGDGLKSKIHRLESSIRDNMSAKYRDGNYVGFVMSGLNDLLSLAQLDISHEGKDVTINQASDFSGLACHVAGTVVV